MPVRPSAQVGLCLLLSLVEVHSQTAPYISFRGETLPNHAYVNLSLVGNEFSGGDSVMCHTDLNTCCTGAQGSHRGNWYFPDENRLSFSSDGGDIYEFRDAQRVHLRRRNFATSPSGIYHCLIPTLAVHDDIAIGDSAYVGLYATGGGVTLMNDIGFTVDSDLNESTPQFTLTCISTGGPATTVTWTRDSDNVTEGAETVLDDPETAQYNHTLTVTGRLGGLYTCNVSNDMPSSESLNLSIAVASAPTDLVATQAGAMSLLVSWKPPNPLGDTTGYTMYYTALLGAISGSIDISGGSTSNYTLTDLLAGLSYDISIVGTSQHLPSDVVYELTPPNQIFVTTLADATNIALSWTSAGSEGVSYEVVWQRNTSLECPNIDKDNVTITDGSTSYDIVGLEEDSTYSITVTALNAAGSSSVTATVITLEAAPSAAPTSVRVSEVTSSLISVHWEMVPCVHRNGDITGYSVQYTGGGSTQIMTVSGASSALAIITGLTPSTSYVVRVAAVNDAGTGVFSDSLSVLTQVERPVVSVDSTTATSISLSWNSGGSEGVSYELLWQRDPIGECPGGPVYNTTTITNGSISYSIVKLEENSTYIIVVRTYNAASTFEVTVTAVTLEAAPSAAPISVSVTVLSPSSLNVQWEMVPCIQRNGEITGYLVQYTGGGSTQIMNVSGASMTEANITGLSPSTAYDVRVAAVNDVGTGVYSDPQSVMTLVEVPVLSAGVTTTTSISLSWTSAGSDVNYAVMWQRDASLECPDVDEDLFTIYNGSTRYDIMGLEEDSRYDVTVLAFNAEDSRALSNTCTAMTLEAAPSAAPSSVFVSSVNDSSITVMWQMVQCIDLNGDITGYTTCYVISDTNSLEMCVPSGGDRTHVVIDVVPNSTYTIRVAAVNNIGTGPFSTEIVIETETDSILDPGPGVPENVQVMNGERDVTISWSAPSTSARVTGYTFSCDPSPPSLPRSFSSPGTYTLTGLTPNTFYNCSLAAYNDQTSGPPVSIAFTTEEDYVIFQKPLSGLFVCEEWMMHFSTEKIQDITNALTSELSTLCQCQLMSGIFDDKRLICFHESSNSVTFQAQISGTADMDSETFVALIENWVATKPTIHVLGALLRVGEECTMTVTELSGGVCSEVDTQTQEDGSDEGSCTGIGASVGIAVAVAVALILTASAVIIVTFYIIRCKRKTFSLKESGPEEYIYAVATNPLTFEGATSPNVAYNTTSFHREHQRAEEVEEAYDVIDTHHTRTRVPPPPLPAVIRQKSQNVDTPLNQQSKETEDPEGLYI